ncbi:zinc ribbon domain-containing protein [Agrilactobacillus yilanensis]|uniref:Zinc ribbon domain-containing protein n=1 Tax=Agrilactobacillus yilanensis TaxID=2485997 RepID=A0ABW4JA86_9LACO|nr:zinc ribbon domain-containing protein [Agrilactobacillus yilanensis]
MEETGGFMMGFCPNCGATIESAQNFCPNCGYPLSTKARKMVMGVTQKMLLVAPQDEDSTTPPTTDEHGILNEPYEPNTRARQTTNQQIQTDDDPYLQGKSSLQTFGLPTDNTSNQHKPELGRIDTRQTTPERIKPVENNDQTNTKQTAPQTLNNYMTRAAFNQMPKNETNYDSDYTSANTNYDSGSAYNQPAYDTTAQPAAKSADQSYTNFEPNPPENGRSTTTDNYNYGQSNANTYGTGGYANDPQYNNQDMNYNPYGNDYQEPAQADYQDQQTQTATDNYNYYSPYNDNTAEAAYDTGTSYATTPMSYGATDSGDNYDDYDQGDDYEDRRDDDNLSFLQKINILDWVSAGLSVILLLTTFVGGFISSGTFGTAGTTSSTLFKTMSLGGSSFKTMMILLLFMLMIGPLALLVFSIWKIHASYIIKLAAAVVSILAYIAVFGILISKGIVAASGLQNFQFGISAIIAIVLLIANFILAVVDFVKY